MGEISIGKNDFIKEIELLYRSKKGEIETRLYEFEKVWGHGDSEKIFTELVFCLLTPMARGKLCWAAVENMVKDGILFKGNSRKIATYLAGARFINKKSMYIVEAREKFLFDKRHSLRDIISGIGNGGEAREWVVKHIKGLGYKEASHFLRNIGFVQDLAILDRHVLRNLKLTGVIQEAPGSLSRGRYLDIEKRMTAFSMLIDIPMSHLDLLMWYKETGEIFK